MKNLYLLLFLSLFLPVLVSAQTDCPFGEVNDSAPGDCGRFVDTDSNSLCDLSEEKKIENISEAELKSKTVKEVAGIYGIDANSYTAELSKFLSIQVNEKDSLQVLHDDNGLCSGVAANIALGLQNETEVVEEETKKVIPRYKFLPIIIALIILYLISYILVKENKISLLTQRRIWNVLLLITFLVSGILGALLVIRINYGWYIEWPFNILYWHVEFGTAMAIISFFHIAWHWRYFTLMLKRRK